MPILCIFLWAVLPGCPTASQDPAFANVRPHGWNPPAIGGPLVPMRRKR